jgi:xanthine/CO dehydrogenase XdhC/CoxF family maturation factor
MNHWKETAEILSRLAELDAAGRRAALATVVHISGSAYRRPGAKFLIEETGGTLGGVSGGCLEADVREVGRDQVLATGTPSLRHYSTGADEDMVWGLGLGCNGQIDVFIQPATFGPLAELAAPLRRLVAGDAPFALATIVEGEGAGAVLLVGPETDPHGTLGSADLDGPAAETARRQIAAGRSTVETIAGRRVFFEVLPPPPHLVVCGAGEDARPLVAYAADAGFRVTVVDHRPALLDRSAFPQAAQLLHARPDDPAIPLPPAERSLAVMMAHSLAIDRGWVRRHLAAGVPYVGVLGPRARTESILEEIGASEADAVRVFGPIGLDIGADGPRQVALSIIAELLAFLAGREPHHLRESKVPIHHE